jgi:hypothetical protein
MKNIVINSSGGGGLWIYIWQREVEIRKKK